MYPCESAAAVAAAAAWRRAAGADDDMVEMVEIRCSQSERRSSETHLRRVC